MAKKKERVSPTRHEKLDDTPVAIPLKFKAVETSTERMRRIIREEMSRAAEDAGHETFEEADDFDVGDDYDPTSPYEMTFEQELNGYDGDEGSADPAQGAAQEGGEEGDGSLQSGGAAPPPSDGGPPKDVPKAG